LQGIIIQWVTETEHKTAGFNLYRKAGNEKEYQKINAALIAARGTAAGGSRYSYTDIPPRPGARCRYLLEEVETGGKTNRYGPVTARSSSMKVMTGTGVFRKALATNCD
jgi:hypothetical protein